MTNSLRRLPPYFAILAALLLIGAPIALAAEGSESAPSGSGTTTSPSTGWVPQGSGSEGSSGGGSEVQKGSSLGSGASVPAPEPDPQPTSSGYEVPSTPSVPYTTPEEATGTYAETETSEAAEEPVAPVVADEPVPKIAGGAAPIPAVKAAAADEAGSATPLVAPIPGEDFGESGGSDFQTEGLIIAAILSIILAALLGWLGYKRLRQHLRWRQERAEWRTAVRRLQEEKRSEPVLHQVAADGPNGHSAAPAKDVPAEAS